jgi:hypothetical protein
MPNERPDLGLDGAHPDLLYSLPAEATTGWAV